MGTSNQIEVFNDLIQINNDRIEGYNKAINNLKEEPSQDLKNQFHNMIQQSQQFNDELINEVKILGGDPENSTTASGNIYRAWMDVKASFGGNDRTSILSSCEFGEDAAKTAYNTAVNNDDINAAQREIIRTQQSRQKASHDKIKLLRENSK